MESLIEVRRAGFEENFKIRRKSTFPEIELSRDSGDGYKYNPAQSDWEAWNAALDSVVVELPQEFDKRDVQGLDYDEVVAAIHAAGVKTK